MAGKKKDSKPSATKTSVTFRQDSTDFKKLMLMFKLGKIKEGMPPPSVRASDPTFEKYSVPQFRAQYHKARNITGDEVEVPPIEDVNLRSMMSNQNPPVAAEPNESEERAGERIIGDAGYGGWRPKMLSSKWINPDGVKCYTALVMLTTGVVDRDNSGVEVEVTQDGNTLTIAETYMEAQLDTESFYQHFRDPSESDADFYRRRFAMMDDVRIMKTNREIISIYKMRTPFRVDLSEKRVIFLAGDHGERYVHVDLSEKKKLHKQLVVMMNTSAKTGTSNLCLSNAKQA